MSNHQPKSQLSSSNQIINNNTHQSKTNTMTNQSNLSYSAFNIDEELQKHLNNIEDSLSDIIPVVVQSSSFNPKVNSNSNSYTPKVSNVITLITSIDNQRMDIELALAIKGYPDLLSYLDFDSKQLTLPDWIENKMLKDYFEYVKLCLDLQEHSNSNNVSDLNYNFKKLTQLTNYFNNDAILSCVMKLNIEPNINEDNCFSLITDAFNYCSSSNDAINARMNDKVKGLWLKLFIVLRTYIISNLLNMLGNPRLNRLPIKLLQDIIEAFLLEIYSKGIEISNEQAVRIIKLILQTQHCNGVANAKVYTDKTSLEEIEDDAIDYLKELSDIHLQSNGNNNFNEEDNYEDTINELKRIPSPLFSIDLLNDLVYHYQEKSVTFHKQELLFITRYDKAEDVFTVSLKLNSVNAIEVFSFISYANIEEDKDYEQLQSKTLNTGMSHCIFRINSFKVYLHYMKGIKDYSSIHLNVNLKFHIIQSFILCYLKSCFSRICKRQSLSHLPLSLFNTLLNGIVPDKEDEPLLAIINWLSNEANSPDDVLDLLESVEWHKVPLGRIFEFVIKYPKLMSSSPVENHIIAAIFSKANRKVLEMKKDKMYQEAHYYERQCTQLSYEGDNEKWGHIAEEEKLKMNKEGNEKEKEKEQLKVSQSMQVDDSQIGIISYFFVNLVECSKKLNYQKLLTENKELKMNKNKGEVNAMANDNTQCKKKMIFPYSKDKVKIFNFNHSHSNESINESHHNSNLNKSRSKSNLKAVNNRAVLSCSNDQVIKMPSISQMSDNNKKESRISNISLSVSNISSCPSNNKSKSKLSINKKGKSNSDNGNELQDIKKEKGQPSIKLKSIAINNQSTTRNNTNSKRRLET